MNSVHRRPGTRNRRIAIGLVCAGLTAVLVPSLTHAAESDQADESSKTKPAHSKGRWVEESFFSEVPKDGVFVTHPGDLPLAAAPEGIPKLTEPRLRKAFALGGKLRDKSGTVVGFAVETEEVLPETDLESGKLVTHSVWTLSIPGRGTLILDQIENSSKVASTVFKPAFDSGKPWVGKLTENTTAGPRKDGKGVILAGTGDFAGARGSGVEIANLRRFDPKTGVLDGTFELRFRYHTAGR
ncbi:hypothetical protein [Streptomyces sp. NPDC007984]|uniref:hypothetical protein n=1 Tax=Streptomyces sp. NPDC007984 TaxID=3364801 RepID=UPI0036E334D7